MNEVSQEEMGLTRQKDIKTALAGAKEKPAVYLYWIPLGAGRHIVKTSGKIFEALSAFMTHRPRNNLYHAALAVNLPEGRFFIEQAPVMDMADKDKGVVAQGPVGMKWLGNFKMFRYEVRCWKDGIIPDLSFAVDSPVKITDNLNCARKIVSELPGVPTPIWGRDQFHTGEMWNSNSVISWVLTRSGINLSSIHLPANGRAPGWNAGQIVALRGL